MEDQGFLAYDVKLICPTNTKLKGVTRWCLYANVLSWQTGGVLVYILDWNKTV